jgi:hypothetical protein
MGLFSSRLASRRSNDEIRAGNNSARRGNDGSRQTIAGRGNDSRMQAEARSHLRWVGSDYPRDVADNRWLLSGPNRRAQNN